MPGQITFEYDVEKNIIFVEEKWDVRTRQDVDEFWTEYGNFIEKVGRKAWWILHIDGLMVHGDVSDYYAEKAKVHTDKWVLGYARWGTDNWSGMTVRTSALKARIPTSMFSTREEAVEAIEELKQGKTMTSKEIVPLFVEKAPVKY
jgi:hypothetical protein